MVDKRISQLPPGLLDDDNDLLVMVDVSDDPDVTKRVTLSNAKLGINYIEEAQADSLVSGANTTLHYHSSDRDLTTHTGASIELTNSPGSTSNTISGNNGVIALNADTTDVVATSKVSINIDGAPVASFNGIDSSLGYVHMTLGAMSIIVGAFANAAAVNSVSASTGSVLLNSTPFTVGVLPDPVFPASLFVRGTTAWRAANLFQTI